MSRKVLKLGLVGLLLCGTSSLSWAGPPNPTSSDGTGSTAGGSFALFNNTGQNNTAFGDVALPNNRNGSFDSAFGALSLYQNTTGTENAAFGVFSLFQNTTGSANSAFGDFTLFNNNGSFNTASGESALSRNTGGQFNTANGVNALNSNTTGNNNTAVGMWALSSNNNGSFNTAIGYGADVSFGGYTNGTAIGANAQVIASNSITLGNGINRIFSNVTSITGISDRRLKKEITPLESDLGLSFVLDLKPVSYQYINGDNTTRFGFIAQDMESALPAPLHMKVETAPPEQGIALVERGPDPLHTYRASYDELIAPIVKAIQEQQREITELRIQNQQLRNTLQQVLTRASQLQTGNSPERIQHRVGTTLDGSSIEQAIDVLK